MKFIDRKGDKTYYKAFEFELNKLPKNDDAFKKMVEDIDDIDLLAILVQIFEHTKYHIKQSDSPRFYMHDNKLLALTPIDIIYKSDTNDCIIIFRSENGDTYNVPLEDFDEHIYLSDDDIVIPIKFECGHKVTEFIPHVLYTEHKKNYTEPVEVQEGKIVPNTEEEEPKSNDVISYKDLGLCAGFTYKIPYHLAEYKPFIFGGDLFMIPTEGKYDILVYNSPSKICLSRTVCSFEPYNIIINESLLFKTISIDKFFDIIDRAKLCINAKFPLNADDAGWTNSVVVIAKGNTNENILKHRVLMVSYPAINYSSVYEIPLYKLGEMVLPT